jgi:hypothetical protein
LATTATAGPDLSGSGFGVPVPSMTTRVVLAGTSAAAVGSAAGRADEQAASRKQAARTTSVRRIPLVAARTASGVKRSAPDMNGRLEALHRSSAEEVFIEDLGDIGNLHADAHDAVTVSKGGGYSTSAMSFT